MADDQVNKAPVCRPIEYEEVQSCSRGGGTPMSLQQHGDLGAGVKMAAVIANHKKNASEQVQRFNFERSEQVQHMKGEMDGKKS